MFLAIAMGPKRKSDASGAAGDGKKRKAITMEVKVDIVRRAERGQPATSIGHALSLSRSTVATIIKDKEQVVFCR